MITASGFRASVFAVTFFTDFAAKTKAERMIAPAILAAQIRTTTAPRKDQLPWLKLARFGNARTTAGSLRHDRNIIAISGVEGDYDGEEIGFDAAVGTAEKAGLGALLYTSPSHTPDRPRWRVLCPLRREHPPADRKHLLARLNGLYRGAFAHESWTLSQAYYFGSVNHSPAHRVEMVEGETVDELDELDQIALGPPDRARSRAHEPGGDNDGARGDAELVRRIITGGGYHTELCALAARYIGRGIDTRSVGDILRGLMLAQAEAGRDERWAARYRSIGAIIASATEKFAPEAQRRRAIARLTYQLLRQQRSGEEIKLAIDAEAARLDIPAAAALNISAGIMRDIGARHA